MQRSLYLTPADRNWLKGCNIATEPTPDEVASALIRDMIRVDREAEQYAQKESLKLRVLTLTQELERSNADAEMWRSRCTGAVWMIAYVAIVVLSAVAVGLWFRR